MENSINILGGPEGICWMTRYLKKIADKHGKSAAQVTLHWELQRGLITIPKSIHQARIIANTDIYGFELSTDEMKAINALDKNPQRYRPGPQ